MKTICLVSCVKTKRDGTHPAKDLYQSTLFKGAHRYAEKHGDEWYVLSAKYGLVPPEEKIASYEKTLNTMGAQERRDWASDVSRKLRPLVKQGDTVIFLAGLRYREHLEEVVKSWGAVVSIPMLGLGFGEQLQWLGQQT